MLFTRHWFENYIANVIKCKYMEKYGYQFPQAIALPWAKWVLTTRLSCAKIVV
jgi:hypothetical protein